MLLFREWQSLKEEFGKELKSLEHAIIDDEGKNSCGHVFIYKGVIVGYDFSSYEFIRDNILKAM